MGKGPGKPPSWIFNKFENLGKSGQAKFQSHLPHGQAVIQVFFSSPVNELAFRRSSLATTLVEMFSRAVVLCSWTFKHTESECPLTVFIFYHGSSQVMLFLNDVSLVSLQLSFLLLMLKHVILGRKSVKCISQKCYQYSWSVILHTHVYCDHTVIHGHISA